MIKPEELLKKHEAGDSLDRPLDHLVACHRRIEERLSTLERVADYFTSKREEALAAAAVSFRFFDSNGTWHTEDEEVSIFPRMRAGLTADELAYLDHLEEQHDEAEALYARLKMLVREIAAGLSDAEPQYRDTVRKLASLYRAHIASEDEALAAIGRRVLDEGTLAQISLEMKARRGLV